jgi:hypothetical protein
MNTSIEAEKTFKKTQRCSWVNQVKQTAQNKQTKTY